jgi:hypothetical protein
MYLRNGNLYFSIYRKTHLRIAIVFSFLSYGLFYLNYIIQDYSTASSSSQRLNLFCLFFFFSFSLSMVDRTTQVDLRSQARPIIDHLFFDIHLVARILNASIELFAVVVGWIGPTPLVTLVLRPSNSYLTSTW